jgi:hypothetical protein
VTLEAAAIRHIIEHFFAYLFRIVIASEMMLVNILCAGISFDYQMREEFIFWRQVAVDTLCNDSGMVGMVRGKLPTPIGGVHFMAFAAAVLRSRERFGYRIYDEKADYREGKARQKGKPIAFDSAYYPAQRLGCIYRHMSNLFMNACL